MSMKQKIQECSYLWLIYTIAGFLFSYVIAMALYMMSLLWALFYKMDNDLLNVLSDPSVKLIFILIAELVFLVILIKGLCTESGDTILIDIIKHGGITKGSTLLGTNFVTLNLNDIDVYFSDRVEHIDSLDKLRLLNKSEHGYIRFKNQKYLLNDICFISDLKINDNLDVNNLVLKVNRYRYKGIKLLGAQEFNTFELLNNSNDIKIDDKISLGRNDYINRLCNAKVYDYPVSIEKDIKQGLKDSKVSIAIIALCAVILFGIYGWYRNYSSSSFVADFIEVDVVDGIAVSTDSIEYYEDFRTYITDALILLPDKLKEQFIEDGWSLVFVEDDLSSYSMLSSMVTPGQTSGCTFPFYKLIVVKIPNTSAESNKAFLMQTIFHEFGHYFAMKTNALSEEWRYIFEEESATYTSSYAKSSVSEGFACCYADYLLYNEFFKRKSDASYTYIHNLMYKYGYK